MEPGSHEREVRAAQNQSLFRAVNQKLLDLNAAFADLTGNFSIACECANVECLESIEILPDDYLRVRAGPRRFIVLRGHVFPDVESVVQESDRWVVVEKTDTAGAVAELLDPSAAPTRDGPR